MNNTVVNSIATNKAISIDSVIAAKRNDGDIRFFLDTLIRSRYYDFDDSHSPTHYDEVVAFGMNFYEKYKDSYPEINENVLYATLALHDIGYKYGITDHHINGAKMLKADPEVRQVLEAHFSKGEIEMIADAIAEHQGMTSSNIYSAVLKDADNSHLLNVERRLERMIAYNKFKYPNNSDHEVAKAIYERLQRPQYVCSLEENRDLFTEGLKKYKYLSIADIKKVINGKNLAHPANGRPLVQEER